MPATFWANLDVVGSKSSPEEKELTRNILLAQQGQERQAGDDWASSLHCPD